MNTESGPAQSVPDPCTCVEAGILQDFDASSRREWVIANHIGGYGCGSLCGASTRRYHGLLVASVGDPPTRRVSLSRLEETLHLAGETHDLAANQYPGVVHPRGFQYLVRFESWPAPTFLFQFGQNSLRRRYWMAPGLNVTCISYTWHGSRGASLTLKPLVCWKDHHAEFAEREGFPHEVRAGAGTLDICLAAGGPWLHLRGPFVSAAPAGYWHRRIEHGRERERGFDWHEDLFCPGELKLDLEPESTFVVAAGLDVVPEVSSRLWRRCQARAAAIQRQARPRDAVEAALAAAADAFTLQGAESVGRRRRGGGVVAGFPWFGEWGRDTMIALPGLFLETGRKREYSEVLRAYRQWLSEGMLPNRFPDTGAPPEYNTADATLWFVEAIRRLVDAASDPRSEARGFLDAVAEVIERHTNGTRHGIRVDPADGLLCAGEPNTNLTWMDAFVEGRAITPRCGKPVEVNALWLNALDAAASLAERAGAPSVPWSARRDETSRAFCARFVRADGQGLLDVVDTPGGDDESLRPNQVFAVSLPYSPLGRDQQRAVVDVVQANLLTPVGLRTLAPGDSRYRGRFEGGPVERDGAYHQGTVWPWLLGPFALAHFRVHGDRAAALDLLRPLAKRLADAGVGFLPEVYDGDAPHRPGGCVAQAWSVAETLRAWRSLSGAG